MAAFICIFYHSFFKDTKKKKKRDRLQTHLIILMQNRSALPVSYFQHVPKTSRADDNSLCPGQSNHGICLNITPRALEEIHGHFHPSQGAQCRDLDKWVLQPEHPSPPRLGGGQCRFQHPMIKVLIQQASLWASCPR